MSENNVIPVSRGPVDHAIRDQIVEAATEYFSHYGYEKTTVAELARAVGFSKAYIYKFFQSKQEIGEVICTNRLDLIMQRVESVMIDSPTATEKIRRLFRTVTESGTELFFHDRKLYDIAAAASRESWPSARKYQQSLKNIVQKIIIEGRNQGEFERKTPLDETTEAIFMVLKPYVDPVQLQAGLETAEKAPALLASLVLRSLSP